MYWALWNCNQARCSPTKLKRGHSWNVYSLGGVRCVLGCSNNSRPKITGALSWLVGIIVYLAYQPLNFFCSKGVLHRPFQCLHPCFQKH